MDENENKNDAIRSGRLIFISYQIFVSLMRKTPPFSGESKPVKAAAMNDQTMFCDIAIRSLSYCWLAL